MKDYADLEISLHHHDGDSYAIEFRYTQPKSDADIRLGQGAATLARFDFDALHSLAHDPAAYGNALTQGLFADPAVVSAFAQAPPARLRWSAFAHAPADRRICCGAAPPALGNPA